MTLELPRRSSVAGLGALVAAPAIVKVASLMPIKSTLMPEQTLCVRLPNYFHADAFSYALMAPFMRSEVEILE